MTARIAIEKTAILEATLGLIREGGWEGVSARSIAARLGSSTMPIYSAIGSMEDLRALVLDRAEDLLFAEQRRARTGNESLDLAVGYVAFAREEARLFHFVIQGRGLGQASFGPPEPAARGSRGPGKAFPAGEAMEASRLKAGSEVEGVKGVLAGLATEKDREDFLLRSWVFTHGLAELLAAGAFTMDDTEIIRQLLSAGGAFFAIARKGKEEA